MTKQDLLKIFENLGFKIVDNKALGYLVEMSPEDAFVLSSIIGCSYLLHPYGVTMKGRFEVFIHRSVFQNSYYIYTPGLFGRDRNGYIREGNSLNFLSRNYPSIFSGKKYIYIKDIPKNSSSNIERSVFYEARGERQETSSLILFKNFVTGSSGEPFLEYLASLYFINKGYVVENQVSWFQQNFSYKGQKINGGIPDFSAFHSSFSSQLRCLGIIRDDVGIAVNLLPVITKFMKLTKSSKSSNPYQYKLIIGEAKITSASSPAAIKQLKQYQRVELANDFYTIIPDVEDNGIDDIGEIYLKSSVVQVKNSRKPSSINGAHQKIDDIWVVNYLKMLLLGNVSFNAILDLIKEHRHNTGQKLLSNYEAHHLLDAVLSTDNDVLITNLLRNI